MPSCAPLARPLALRKAYSMTRVRRSTLGFPNRKHPKVLYLFRGENAIASGATYRRTVRVFGRNNAVPPFGGGKDRFSANPMGIPSAYEPMPLGFVRAASVFGYPGAPRPTDAKPSIVNSDRPDSRRHCLLPKRGLPREQVSRRVSLQCKVRLTQMLRGTRNAVRMCLMSLLLPQCGFGECALSTSTQVDFSNLTLCNRRV